MKTSNVVVNLSENAPMGNWEMEHLGDGSMRFVMDRYTSVYVQNGIARAYDKMELVAEAYIKCMNPTEFNEWLLGVEKEYNN